MTIDRVPQSPVEVLSQIDAMLVESFRGFDRARATLVDVQPGLSGRPAGSGEPPGGSSVFTHSGPRASSSVVERAVDDGSNVRGVLARLEVLPGVLHGDVVALAARAGVRLSAPAVLRPGRRVEWCHVAVRSLIDTGMVRRTWRRDRLRLHGHAVELAGIVGRWSAPATKSDAPRSLRLVADPTELWCESCLRTGMREPRSERYPTRPLCRWCGDFEAAQGFLPTLDLLDARRDGRRITEAMVREAKPRTVPTPRQRSRRR